MGIESYLIADSLVGIIAQRLVRKLCDCKMPKEASAAEKEMLGVNPVPLHNLHKNISRPPRSYTAYGNRRKIHPAAHGYPFRRSHNPDAVPLK